MNRDWYARFEKILRWPALAVGAAATGVSSAGASTGDLRLETQEAPDAGDAVVLPNRLNETATDRYAAHRSHRSHGSHRSHRSSSGGGRAVPTPSVPAPSTTAPRVPQTVPQTTPSVRPQQRASPSEIPKPSPQDLSMMTVRVQAALMRLGIYQGDIDGLLGPQTREALKAFQKSKGISQTGRMDIETLTQLGISIP